MTDEQKFEVGSSSSGPNGWSSLGKFLDCSIKAHLERENARERIATGVISTPFPEGDSPTGTLVGTIFDRLATTWLLTGEDHGNDILWWEQHGNLADSHPLSVAEARRIFEAYHKHYNRDHLGEILASQMPVMIPKELTGLDDDLTGNLDLVVRENHQIGIVDLKTHAAETADLKMYFSLRPQFWLYAWGYELATGVKPDFCLADVTIKTKKSKFNAEGPKFRKFRYGGLTEDRLKWLQSQFVEVKAKMANPRPEPKIAHCWPYSTPCSHYDEARGVCSFT